MSEETVEKMENEASPEQGRSGRPPKQRTMLVRYGRMGLMGLFGHDEREIAATWKHVIVQTERGLEMGEVVSPYFHEAGTCAIKDDRIESYCRASGGSNYPLSRVGRFVRQATAQDLNEQRHLDLGAREEFSFCEKLIGKHNLPMVLVDVEHLFGGDRIIYYFTAEHRVDFRALVKELAHEYQTRIEMRQIGARDEARLLADYETCGRQCCCKNFLKVLQPVNMRMAKQQKATLDPSKISGRCGRLKCCLRYEDKVYGQLMKLLPRMNSWVRTSEGVGQVIDRQILTQLVKVRLESGRIVAANVSELEERDMPKPEPRPEGAAVQESRERRESSGSRQRGLRDGRGGREQRGREEESGGGEEHSRPNGQEDSPASEEQAQGESGQGKTEASGEGGQPRKKRRRRRKRRKSGDGGGGDGGSGQSS